MPAKEYIYSAGRLLAVVAQDNTSGGPSYTTDHLEAFWGFDEGSGSTVYDQVGSADATIAGTPDWSTDGTGLYGNNLSTGVTSFNGNTLSAYGGEDYTVIWVGTLRTSGGWQALWSHGNNVSVQWYSPTLYVGVNGSGTFLSTSGLAGKTVMITLRVSNNGANAQLRIGTGSWQNASVGTTVNTSPGLRMGILAGGGNVNATLTESLMWVYSDDLTDSEVEDNYDWADGEITARGGTLE